MAPNPTAPAAPRSYQQSPPANQGYSGGNGGSNSNFGTGSGYNRPPANSGGGGSGGGGTTVIVQPSNPGS